MKRTTITVIATLTLGCRAQGLPEIPADQDAVNPGAPAAAYAGSSDDTKARGELTKSAFDGVKLGKGGHEGMNHGGMKMDMPADEGEVDDSTSKPGAMDHGGMKMDTQIDQGEARGTESKSGGMKMSGATEQMQPAPGVRR